MTGKRKGRHGSIGEAQIRVGPDSSAMDRLQAQPYALTIDQVLADFRTRPRGLSSAEAAKRLVRDGPNRLPSAPSRSPLVRFLSHP